MTPDVLGGIASVISVGMLTGIFFRIGGLTEFKASTLRRLESIDEHLARLDSILASLSQKNRE